MEKKHLYLIDGYAFVFRAYYSIPAMSRKDGTPTNAVYGFVNMLMDLKKMAAREGAGHMLVLFDAGGKTFRHDIYKEYKSHRPPVPEDLIPQFALVKQAAEAMNLPNIALKGFEADDLIATYTQKAYKSGYQVTIASSDKDLMQLIREKKGTNGAVQMYDAMKKTTIRTDEVLNKFGVTPCKILDFLALVGDSADNIPGIPGIGPKTAAELLNLHGDMDNVLANASSVKQKKRRENLIEFADQARMSKELASLHFETPTQYSLDELTLNNHDSKLDVFLEEQGFLSLKRKYCKNNVASIKNPTTSDDIVITDKGTLEKWLKMTVRSNMLAISSHHKKLNDPSSQLIGYSLASSDEHFCYIPISDINKTPQQNNLFDEAETQIKSHDEAASDEPNNLSQQIILDSLYLYLNNNSILKISNDVKSLIKISTSSASYSQSYEDVTLMSYILDGSKHKHNLTSLVMENFGEDISKENYSQAHAILRLYKIFKQRIFDEKLTNFYQTVNRPLVAVLAKMENNGILVDNDILKKLSNEFATKIAVLEVEIYKSAAESSNSTEEPSKYAANSSDDDAKFNIASPKQLGEVLFDKMGIEGGKKSKNGSYKTGSDILESLSSQGHIIADYILEWRALSKLKNTYTDALSKEINPKTRRIHTNFSITTTSTGRLSSLNPNLQNIPVRSGEGRKIRSAFIPKQGCKFVSADYSQIELRLLAHIADIESLKQAFAAGEDIHAKTASQVFNIPIEDVDKTARSNAKAINFGIIYGQSAFGLATQLGIERAQAKAYIEAYFQQYPGIKQYMDDTINFAKEHGYVTTLMGGKCYLNGIKSSNGMTRSFAERAAINAPLQGTAADIIKKAMIKVDNSITKQQLKSNMILQVHDELILEVPEDEINIISKILRHDMESVINLSVKLVVDVESGNNWGEIH